MEGYQVDPMVLYDKFISANDLRETLDAFNQMCSCLGLDPLLDDQGFYQRLKSKLSSNWKAEKLWYLLDKRVAQKEYRKQRACLPLKVLIIGAGPCGLRAGIECALLGAKAVIVEKRDRFSRNNVLHLWPFVIQDLKTLGGKLFYPKFCAGSIDHISIRQLQCILLKVALVLGVEVHDDVSFEHVIPPEILQQTAETLGWRAEFWPQNHYLRDYQFQALIAADGKRNTIPCFERKEMRGKLAIGITANFVNGHSWEEERVQEISGVAFIFNQQFFKEMREKTLIDLENIVYYKDETHYFVMCAKKPSLIEKGVIRKDCEDVSKLLAPANINQKALLDYAKEAADFSTKGALRGYLNYSVNHLGEPDVAMFDFTSLYSSRSSCRMEEKNGHQLMMAVVGDSLHEPFWPTGSGVARGFLGVLDSSWMLKCLCSGKQTPLQVMAERECIYRLLAQTKPENLHKNLQKYTVDPKSRYPRLDYNIQPEQVIHLVVTDKPQFIDTVDPSLINHGTITPAVNGAQGASPAKKRKLSESETKYIQRQQLIRFVQAAVNYSRLRVINLGDCWENGMTLAALLHRFRSDLVDLAQLSPNDARKNREDMFEIVRREYGLEPPSSDGDQGSAWRSNQDEMFLYVSTLCEKLKTSLMEEIEKLSATRTPPVAKVLPTPVVKSVGASERSVAIEAANSAQKRKAAAKLERSMSSPEEERVADLTWNRDESKLVEEFMAEEELDVDQDEVDEWLKEWEKEENTKVTPGKRRGKMENIRQDLANRRSQVTSKKGKVSSPAMVEKLPPDRVREVESLLLSNLSGKVTEVERRKKKKPPIKTRKLDQREIEEMETKLEQTAMGSLLFKKDYEKALSRKEELAIAAKTSDLKRKALNGFSDDPEGRFESFDSKMKALDKKLKTPNTSGAFKVEDLTKVHTISTLPKKAPVPLPFENAAPLPPAGHKSPSTPVGLPPDSQQPCCYLCGVRVYLAERICVEGFFLHNRCFRCAYCDSVLRLGAYGFERSEAYGNQFFCRTHLNLSFAEKLNKLKNKPPRPPSITENSPRQIVGEVRPLQTKMLTPLSPSAAFNGGEKLIAGSPKGNMSPTGAAVTRPGAVERPPPIVHYPAEKGNAEYAVPQKSPRSTAKFTLDTFLTPKIKEKAAVLEKNEEIVTPSEDKQDSSPRITPPSEETVLQEQEDEKDKGKMMEATENRPEPPPRSFYASSAKSSSVVLSEVGSAASMGTPERAEFVFHSEDDALGEWETGRGEMVTEKERKATERLPQQGFESGEISDDESSSEDDELALSEEEWADLEKTLSLKRGSQALTYNEAAELARTWRQRQQRGRESENSESAEDSDDEGSDDSETFNEIAGKSFKDSKMLTPSVTRYEKETDRTVYYTPNDRTPDKFSEKPEIFETPAVPREDSIPFVDRSPESLTEYSVIFRTPSSRAAQGTERWSTPVIPSATPLRQIKMQEFQRLKEEARRKAKLKSDDELGLSGMRLYASESRLPTVGERRIGAGDFKEKLDDLKLDFKGRTGSLVEEVLVKSTEIMDAKNEVFFDYPLTEETPTKETEVMSDTTPKLEEKQPQKKITGFMARILSPLKKKPPSPAPSTEKEVPSPAPAPSTEKEVPSPAPSTEKEIPSPAPAPSTEKVKSPESENEQSSEQKEMPASVQPTVSIESGKEANLLRKVGRKYAPRRKNSSPGKELDGGKEEEDEEARRNEKKQKGPAKATIDETSLSGSQDSLDAPDKPDRLKVERGSESDAVSEKDVRKIQKAAESLVRQQEQKWTTEAQDLQRKLQEVEVRKMEVEQNGNKLERRLREDPEDRWALEQWLVMVNERNGLEQYENDLHLRKRELELEQEHSRLQNELRNLMVTGQAEKTREDLQAEQRVLEEMLLIVAQRDALVSQMDRDKRREAEAEMDIARAMTKKGFSYKNFNPVFIESRLNKKQAESSV